MTKKNAAIQNGEKTLKTEISVNYLIQREAKENETAKQLKKRIEREKRAATNQARSILARDIKHSLFSFKIVRQMFAEDSREASDVFCANLSAELGKDISVDSVLRIPMRDLLDYVTEIEATRGMIRGGITPTEFTHVIARYYRGAKVGIAADKDALISAYTHAI